MEGKVEGGEEREGEDWKMVTWGGAEEEREAPREVEEDWQTGWWTLHLPHCP